MPLTVKQAINLLVDNGYSKLNQRGSHIKFGKEGERFTIIYHSNDKETISSMIEKKLKKQLGLNK
jgi:predicted RNA binding protein YcfA (HicA-like mRNA interferase family)